MADRPLHEIRSFLEQSREAIAASLADDAFMASVSAAAEAVTRALAGGRKILVAGNGGSAADAQHIAGEIVGRFMFDRAPLPALALTVDSSILTAVANDYGIEHIFERQVRGLGQGGDVFLGLSTSGGSPNVVAALETARRLGITTVGLTGNRKGPMLAHCDIAIEVPSPSTPLIQQVHMTVGHILCAIAEERIFGASRNA